MALRVRIFKPLHSEYDSEYTWYPRGTHSGVQKPPLSDCKNALNAETALCYTHAICTYRYQCRFWSRYLHVYYKKFWVMRFLLESEKTLRRKRRSSTSFIHDTRLYFPSHFSVLREIILYFPPKHFYEL